MIDISMTTALFLYTICFIFGFIFMMVLYYFIDKKENNYLHFFLFFGFSLVGALLLAFSNSFNVFIGKVVANSLVVIAYMMLPYGIRKIYGLKENKSFYFITYLLYLSLFVYFLYFDDNIFARVYLVNFTNIGVLGYGLYSLIKERKITKGHEVMSLAIFSIMIMAILRTVNFMINSEVTNQFLLFKYDPFFIVLAGIANLFVIPGILSIIKNQKEKSLSESEKRLSKSQEVANVGSWELDIKTNKIWASDEAFRIYEIEHKSDYLDVSEIKKIPNQEDRKMMDQALENLINKEEEYNITFSIDVPSGHKIIHSVAELTYDSDGNPDKVLGVIRDITELKKYQDSLIHMSNHDELTGLYNRRYYEEQISLFENNQELVSLIMADINGLKLVNDAFGHQKGDDLLRKAAELLEKHNSKNGILCRIGGDEFVYLLPKTNMKQAEHMVNKIREETKKIKIENINLSISFGIGERTSNMNINEVFRLAEDRMYQAKLVNVPSMRGSAINSIMSTLNEKDKDSENHARQVSKISALIAQKMNLPQDQINQIRNAGLLHDIGKIIIPSDIINKKGPLTDSENEIIKTHPIIGYRILNSVSDTRSIAQIVLSHHEYWDGNGYPNQLSKSDIPLKARIIAIADAFDEMTSKTYQRPKSNEEALEELIRLSGKQFDPDIVEVFKEHFEEITKELLETGYGI